MTEQDPDPTADMRELLGKLIDDLERHRQRLAGGGPASIDDLDLGGLVDERLDRARSEWTFLVARAKRLGHRRRFLAETWHEVQDELERHFQTDEPDGIAAWLTDCAIALAEWRLDAFRRLINAVEVPASVQLLRERLADLAGVLDEEVLGDCYPAMSALADGVVIGDRPMVAARARGVLHILLARLILDSTDGDDERAVRHVDAASDLLGEIAPVIATRALLARVSNDVDQGLSLTVQLARAAHDDLGALVEYVHLVGDSDPSTLANVVEDAVAALLERDDVFSEIERLRVELPAPVSLALARQALNAEQFHIAEWVFNRTRTDWSDADHLRASDLRVELLEHIAALPETIADELADGAFYRMQIDPPDTAGARLRFERARNLEPYNLHRVLQWADSVVYDLQSIALEVARADLLATLDQVEEALSQGVVGASGWGFLTEAAIRERLAEGTTPDATEQRWRCTWAALRAVAHDLFAARNWREVANGLRIIDAFDAAAVVAEHAVTLPGADDFIVREAVAALVNAGRDDDARQLLGRLQPTPWVEAVRGLLLVREGKPAAGVELLDAATRTDALRHDWWAWGALLRALHLCGDDVRAREVASALWRAARERPAETGAMLEIGNALWELGFADQAAAAVEDVLAIEPRNLYANMLVALARLVDGDADGVYELLGDIFAGLPPREIVDFERLEWARQTRLCARYGIALRPLEDIVEGLAGWRSDLPQGDPWRELAVEPADVDERVVALVRHVGGAALAIATDNLDRADDELRALVDEPPEEVGLFLDGIARLRGDADPTYPDLAFSDPPSSTPRAVVELRGRRWGPDALASLEGAAGDRLAVSQVIEAESEGFRILVDGHIVDEVELDPTAMYCFRSTLSLLPPSSVPSTQPVVGVLPDLVRLEASEDPGIDPLLLLRPEEVVAQRARAHLDHW